MHLHPAKTASTGRSVGPRVNHLLELLARVLVQARFSRTREKFAA